MRKFHTSLMTRLVTVLVALGLLCGVAGATEGDMAQLPVVDPFLCLLCHASSEPSALNDDLNVFGDAFLAAGRVWNAELAAGDADEDGCLNGVELGDADADGLADGNVTSLQTNPGNGTDCGVNSVDSTTWTELKGLFNRK